MEQEMHANDIDELQSIVYSSLFSCEIGMVCILDKEGRIEKINDSFSSFTGYTQDEIRHKKLFELPFLLSTHPRKLRSLFSECMEGQCATYNNAVLMKRAGGSTFVTIVTFPLRDSRGRTIGGLLHIYDTTRQKKLEDDLGREHRKLYLLLKERNEQLNTTLERTKIFKEIIDRSNMVLLIWKWKLEELWPLEFASDNLAQFGYTLDDFTNRTMTWEKFIYKEDYRRVKAEEEEHWRNKILNYIKVYRIVTKTGEIRWVSDRTRVLTDSKGAYTHLQDILVDITEEKKIEKELSGYRKKLEEMVEQRTSELEVQKNLLEQKNIALQEVLRQIEDEKERIKKEVAFNIQKLLLPLLEHLRNSTSSVDSGYIDVLSATAEDLSSSFGRKIYMENKNLTPRELEICNLLKNGLASKQISDILYITPQSVDWHRNNIRKKLGIVGKEVNLVSYLQNF